MPDEEQRARADEIALRYGTFASRHELRIAVAQALAQESAREALAWETLIKSSIAAAERRNAADAVTRTALTAAIGTLRGLLAEIQKARAQVREGT